MNFPPGTQYEYSNTNTVLLGMVVEKVSGLPLGDYLAQNVFGPLGLSHTSFPANGLLPGPYTHGYNKAPDGQIVDATLWNPSWGYAAGAVVSTMADMKTWAASLGKGALLRPDTQAQRLGNGSQVGPGLTYSFAILDANGWIGHTGDIRLRNVGGLSAGTRRHAGGDRQLRCPGSPFSRPARGRGHVDRDARPLLRSR
jgi:D-alanyl-D-alanine carboxypeptidase